MRTCGAIGVMAFGLLLGAACDDATRTNTTTDVEDENVRPRPDVDENDARVDQDATDASANDGSGSDAGDGDTSDASDGSGAGDDVSADVDPDSGSGDASDTGGGDDAGDVGTDVVTCPTPPALYTGMSAIDVDGDPLEVGDEIAILVEVMGTAGDPVTLDVVGTNLAIDASSVTLDGTSTSVATIAEGRLRLDLDPGEPVTVEFSAEVVATSALVVAFAQLDQLGGTCTVPRSRSGAILQVIGGNSKTPLCVDMREVRSVQVAPEVALQNTSTYAAENGRRTDLLADDFIFCPQSPTIVHEAEFCLERDPGQSITLGGTYAADGDWEVDDFMLFEVFEIGTGELLDDGFTSQTHPGGSTFWCGEISRLMCTSPCTASLTEIDEDREIETIAVVPATGARPRRHDDGAVDIAPLLPADGSRADLRITALDQGVEGRLAPGLYLVSDEP